jgi:hypothetical protein
MAPAAVATASPLFLRRFVLGMVVSMEVVAGRLMRKRRATLGNVRSGGVGRTPELARIRRKNEEERNEKGEGLFGHIDQFLLLHRPRCTAGSVEDSIQPAKECTP